MKKLIAGFVMAVVVSPAAQAWTGGIEDMRTMEANERGPIIRIKSDRITVCGVCNPRYHAQRGVRYTYRPHRYIRQPAYNQARRVVSEKIYVQKVHRYPATTCPLR